MKVITGPRQSGKTTEAVELANERNAYLVVHTSQRARTVNEQFDMEQEAVSIHRLQHGELRGIHPRRFVVDDLDMLLPRLLGEEVAGFAVTAEDTEVLGR